jgi:hypothetical protein
VPKKVGNLILSSAAGTAIGFGIYLFATLVLPALYGDDGQGEHPTEFLESFLVLRSLSDNNPNGFWMGLVHSQEEGTISFLASCKSAEVLWNERRVRVPWPPPFFSEITGCDTGMPTPRLNS